MSKRKIRNRKVIKQLCAAFLKYSQVMFVKLDNVSNMQIQKARVALQKSEKPGEFIIGKNTIVLKALKWLTTEPEKGSKEFEDHSKWGRRPELKNLIKHIQGSFGLIFSDEDYSSVREKIEKEVLRVDAKVGAVSPCDVIIPAGPTTIDVGKIAVFQKLNVQTKSVKNMLEILKDIHVIKKNEKVSAAGGELCRLLGVKPFSYKLELKKVWLNGTRGSPRHRPRRRHHQHQPRRNPQDLPATRRHPHRPLARRRPAQRALRPPHDCRRFQADPRHRHGRRHPVQAAARRPERPGQRTRPERPGPGWRHRRPEGRSRPRT